MATLKSQRSIAARMLKCGQSRVWFNPARQADIEEAITVADVRRLINSGVIKEKPVSNQSTGRKKYIAGQKRKGRRKGRGSRKGASGTRMNRKVMWVRKIRLIRKTLKELYKEGKITRPVYTKSYRMASGGFFRSKNHLVTHLEKEKLLVAK